GGETQGKPELFLFGFGWESHLLHKLLPVTKMLVIYTVFWWLATICMSVLVAGCLSFMYFNGLNLLGFFIGWSLRLVVKIKLKCVELVVLGGRILSGAYGQTK